MKVTTFAMLAYATFVAAAPGVLQVTAEKEVVVVARAAAPMPATNTKTSTKKSSTKKSSSTKTSTKSASKTTTKASSQTSGSSSGGSSGGKQPAASGTLVLKAAQTITSSYDGGMKQIDRGVSCTGQAEGGSADAVFILASGASLSNVIIGPNQIEGVHCLGACTLTNVWWAKVCEDALTIKTQSSGQTTYVKGGGAYGAADKVIQHNGLGTVNISGFTVNSFGKLYRACGNCSTGGARHVVMSGITASNGKELAGINSNFGDTAKISNSKLTSVSNVCTRYKGVSSGSEPTKIGSGADGTNCIYGSDVVSS